ncbi:MAG: VUT family protein [Bacteroidetes bacterium]|nr:MAG: VUT family protein [Bacteroidota bacterium]
MYKREHLLFVILGGFFISNALVAEFIGVKIFSLEKTLGFAPVDWSFLGQSNLSFNLTAGVILWPVVFVMTDIINEYYGKRGVRILSYLTVVMISYAYVMVTLAIGAKPADFWISQVNTDIQPNIDVAYGRIFGQGLGVIVGSLIAFLVGQLVDVTVFQYLRRFTGARRIWLRATGSTLVSQFIDSFVVLFVAFYFWPGAANRWTVALVLAVGTVNYIYKFVLAIVLTPLLYLLHWVIDRYLGQELSERLIREAAGENS